MVEVPRSFRRSAQALFCASAIAAGGWLAHATEASSADRAPHAFPPPMPEHLEVEPAAREAQPDPEPPPPSADPTGPVHAVAPLRPVAEPLAGGRVITGRTPHRLILFTFDDGPDARNTPRLLDMLDGFGIKAVFFLTANRIEGTAPWQLENREVAHEIVRRGHIVANHTMTHPQLPLLSTEDAIREVEGAEAVFTEVLGERTWLVRPPGGARSPRVDGLLADRGYTQVLWNLGTGDFQVREPEEVLRIFRRVLARRERENGDRGGIVLLHDTHEWSVEAFPMIMAYLRERNCELIEEGAELFDVVDDPSFFYAELGDAPPTREAAPADPSPLVIRERQRALRVRTRQRCDRLAAR